MIETQPPLVIEYAGKTFSLHLQDFDTDVDVEEILKIDYGNIMGEILTFPVLFNRIGNLKAEYDNIVKMEELDFEIWMAQKEAEQRKKLTFSEDRGKGVTKQIAPSIPEVQSAIKALPDYKLKYSKLLTVRKNMQNIDAIYWSAKAKGGMLENLSGKLRPEEFEGELLQDTVNGILVKQHKSNMRDELSRRRSS